VGGGGGGGGGGAVDGGVEETLYNGKVKSVPRLLSRIVFFHLY